MWHPLITQPIVKDSASDAIVHAGHNILKKSHKLIIERVHIIMADITSEQEINALQKLGLAHYTPYMVYIVIAKYVVG